MKKTSTSNYMRWLGTLAVLLAFVWGQQASAQNVTISPSSGNMVTGVAGANDADTGGKAGFYSLWQHNQLSLTMETSDIGSTTIDGGILDPTSALTTYNEKMVVVAGYTQTFMVVSLPKGYRFTGYTAVLKPNLNGVSLRKNQSGSSKFTSIDNTPMCFYETSKWANSCPFTDNSTPSGSGQTTPKWLGVKGNLTVLNEGQYLAVAEASDGDRVMNPSDDSSKEFIITRTSMTDDDMGNRLYFWVGKDQANGDTSLSAAEASDTYAFTIESFELYFTAEGTFEVEASPVSAGTTSKYEQSPFSTSKSDIGEVKLDNTTGTYTYNYTNVRDLVSYLHLYQDDAVSDGVPVSGNGNITPVIVDDKAHYAFGNDIYYIETPISYKTVSAWNSPIGFRIVGATFTPHYGTATSETTVTVGNYTTISCSGGSLGTNTLFGTGGINWLFDEYGNMYTGSGDYKQYLSCYGDGNFRNLSLSSTATGSEAFYNLKRDNNGHLYYTSRSGAIYYLYAKQLQEGGSKNYRGFLIKSPITGTHANTYGYLLLDDDATEVAYNTTGYDYISVSSSNPTGTTSDVTIPAFTPGAYTLKVYDKTGENVLDVIDISGADDSEVGVAVSFDDYNNDAIKFEISDLADGKKAIVDVKLKLQALNPYIDQMSVVCSEPESSLRMTQTFTASDFTVNGGTFHFILPAGVADKDVNITFEDLYSHYGDEKYGGMGNARYSFVSSPYFSAFDQVAHNAVPPTNPVESLSWNNDSESDDGLYDERYSPDIESTHKIYTGVAGDKPFTFNNASVLSSGGNLREYFFSVAKYTAPESTTFADGSTGTGGTFSEIVMNANNLNGHSNEGTYYLFTADETRYNIAPTTAWQHRFYAFYTMGVSLETASYYPQVEFKKVYDSTFGASGTGAYYGAVVTAPYTDNGDSKQGYASTADIFTIIDKAVQGSTETGTVNNDDGEKVGTYTGRSSDLTNSGQLLYLDFSQLAGTYQITTDTHGSMEDYSNTNAANCMIFLPQGASAPNDNVAAKTASGIFKAAHNIKLTDMEPFYTPYDIQVDAANYVYYDRKVTQRYGGIQENKVSIIMPFEFVVDEEGKYYDPDNGTPMFSLHTMQATNCLTDGGPTEDGDVADSNEGFVFFPYITPVKTKTEANKPYLLRVLNTPSDETLSFVVRQKGGTVKATTGMDANYLFTGETATGSSSIANESTVNYTFNAYGGYSGQLLPHTSSSPTYFYFAKNKFVSSDQLLDSYTTIKVLPFRSYYLTTKSTTGVKGLNELGIIFNEGIGNSEATGIEDVKAAKPDLMIEVGKGYMTLTSTADQDVKVYSVSGVNVLNAKMQVGESRTVAVPGGIYIVNGAKLIVK